MRGNIRSVFEVTFLPIITCGIYSFYWIYVTTNELNDYINDGDTSGGMVLVYEFLTCGIYTLYWYYKIGKRIMTAQQLLGRAGNDDSILYLILAVFALPIIANAIIQSNLNKLWRTV
ncbi:DUF4234 domain-containing protein [Clostridium botulinum]|uniref:DUF4234 domain-containing protein n=1 Tax=Clostridium botulinum C/D str. DC5 TaxID=1443128 RepID=A0A0A0IL06_CLOBO|nr:DUF4234 domain-containing protein [Clostridium botulinum]KGM94397.1 hypothetical protein Z956_07745 [Clostridium botulinum D str. CCUG 7971]KGN00236.1 hypothetical protein Z955_04365 [Clostridium botulinum C/D str. DC5]KOC50173.1 hypothetical protein ADU89_14710 [Clostridium botulinum]KOC50629.1 hypothetical protein ADU88_01755 [Clostridium botulinum]KOC57659.1 hypothetical protein ADU90_04585 [Clostridium botulinum]